MNAVLLKVFGMVLKAATPEIVDAARRGLDDLAQRAAKTPNPVDDILVEILQEIIA